MCRSLTRRLDLWRDDDVRCDRKSIEIIEAGERVRAGLDGVSCRIRAEGQAARLAFRIVNALLDLAAISPVITRGWAEACLTRLDACPPGLCAPVLTAAAWNAYLADDYPLTQQRAEQAEEAWQNRHPAIRSPP